MSIQHDIVLFYGLFKFNREGEWNYCFVYCINKFLVVKNQDINKFILVIKLGILSLKLLLSIRIFCYVNLDYYYSPCFFFFLMGRLRILFHMRNRNYSFDKSLLNNARILFNPSNVVNNARCMFS